MAHYKPNVGKLPLDAMVKIFAGCLWIYFVWPAPHMPRGRGEAHESCLVNPSTRARGQCTIYKKLRSCSFDQFTFLFSPALPSNNFCGVVQINIFLVEVHMNARAIVHMPHVVTKLGTNFRNRDSWIFGHLQNLCIKGPTIFPEKQERLGSYDSENWFKEKLKIGGRTLVFCT